MLKEILKLSFIRRLEILILASFPLVLDIYIVLSTNRKMGHPVILKGQPI